MTKTLDTNNKIMEKMMDSYQPGQQPLQVVKTVQPENVKNVKGEPNSALNPYCIDVDDDNEGDLPLNVTNTSTYAPYQTKEEYSS